MKEMKKNVLPRFLMGRSAYPENSTVTLTHSRTKNLKELLLQADIIISAIGKPNFLTADMVKDGVMVMDVGITRLEDSSKKSGYRIVGDVDFESVSDRKSTRLNSSHVRISYAVFCLKKKTNINKAD